MEEQSEWDAHASFMDGLVDDGFVVLGGPLADEERVVHAVEAESEETIRAMFARDPWCDTLTAVNVCGPEPSLSRLFSSTSECASAAQRTLLGSRKKLRKTRPSGWLRMAPRIWLVS